MPDFRCYYCGDVVDVVNQFYFKSVNFGVYMHLGCFQEYEVKLKEGRITPYHKKEKWYARILRRLQAKARRHELAAKGIRHEKRD
jgi:hypothetical protein